jgi:lipoprotein-anchoring transpeptidase ErfK/SrfK
MADWLQLQARYPTPRDPMAVVVDVATKSLYLLDDGQRIDTWPVSTGLRGTGNLLGGDTTPLGVFDIVRKIGTGLPEFTILSSQAVIGTTARPVFASDDPRASLEITTRILWLEGLQPGWNEGGDVDTYARHIFIHGTAKLGMLGDPASLGCVQMAPGAMISLYRHIPLGTLVLITSGTGILRDIPGDPPFTNAYLAGNAHRSVGARTVTSAMPAESGTDG